MKAPVLAAVLASLMLASPHLVRAQQEAERAEAPPSSGHRYAADPFVDRLERLLNESRAQKRRVVLFARGEEIAGVVLELGPGWVMLSNQPEQEILLRTIDIDRAEFR